ncbi:aminopeptidase [Sporosalibacterium faouarense]|uniref:aminopeptidase n=1 Tax=Sporosalibacterium faouarense TaxID=516123 RepID=UPI00192AAD26|nr:aminopeptidase [Sporosalibacterium faouarense]
MTDFQKNLEKYAEIAIKIGVNLQENQSLVIRASINAKDIVRKIVKKAYEAGGKDVLVEWSDDEVSLIRFMNAPKEALKEFPKWKAEGYAEMAKNGTAFLTVSAPNPDLLKDIDPSRVALSRKTSAMAMKDFSFMMRSGKVNWTALVIPTESWAEKVYPDLTTEDGLHKLWDDIFKITRVATPDPISAWKEHINNLQAKLELLNSKKYKKLHFKGPGTDLTMNLPDDQVWIGGGMTTESGIFCVPNVPTEEVFTAPLKSTVNGTVKSTKPLSYNGSLIDNFSFTFENGKIVDFSAEQGYEVLKKMLETDETSPYLGEVALVPHDSPISNTKTVFYNTLFDENASCHLAVGSAYASCIENGGKMSKDELEGNDLNTSLIHVDFMIGSAELNIDGETPDGKIEPIFRKGNWDK